MPSVRSTIGKKKRSRYTGSITRSKLIFQSFAKRKIVKKNSSLEWVTGNIDTIATSRYGLSRGEKKKRNFRDCVGSRDHRDRFSSERASVSLRVVIAHYLSLLLCNLIDRLREGGKVIYKMIKATPRRRASLSWKPRVVISKQEFITVMREKRALPFQLVEITLWHEWMRQVFNSVITMQLYTMQFYTVVGRGTR